MILKTNMAEVKIFAPALPDLPPMQCWRLHRGDNELRRAYQAQVIAKHGIYIPLPAIQVEGDYKRAA